MLDFGRTLCCALLFGAGTACSTPGTTSAEREATRDDAAEPARARPMVVEPTEPVIDLFPGERVVMPLRPVGGEAAMGWTPDAAIVVTDGDGERLDHSLWWILGTPKGEAPEKSWLPPTSDWNARNLVDVMETHEGQAEPSRSGFGFWALMVETPKDGERAPLRLGNRVIPTRRLGKDGSAEVEASTLAVTPEAKARLAELLHGEARDPLRRWRVRLLRERFGMRPSDDERFESGVLEAMALQYERRWRAALARLRRDDPALARDVLERLTAVVRFESGALLPAWPLDDAEQHRLRGALLDPTLSRDERVGRAEAWLASLPSATAWVINDETFDAGANARSRARIGVARFGGSADAGTIRFEGGEEAALTLGRFAASDASVLVDGSKPGAGARVSLGDWTSTLSVQREAVRVTPPGLTLGPLRAGWSMAGWLIGRDSTPDPAWTTAALLQRSPDGSRWEVYVECLHAEGSTNDLARERVRVFIRGADDAGEVRIVEAARKPDLPGDKEPISRDDRWSAVLPLSLSSRDEGGIIRLAVERVDARGVRSTWPRAMMPGDASPAMARIDLSGWAARVGAWSTQAE